LWSDREVERRHRAEEDQLEADAAHRLQVDGDIRGAQLAT
jgi:hypothetical protein